MITVKVKVTETEVSVLSKSADITSGNIENIKFEFDLAECFDGLTVRAMFDDTARLVVNEECIAPCFENCEYTLGVYGYELCGENYVKRISPKPARFYASKGSYKEASSEEKINPAEIELLTDMCRSVVEKAENGEFNGNDGAPGPKGDKGDAGAQGPPGKDAVTDSAFDIDSSNAIANAVVATAINEISENASEMHQTLEAVAERYTQLFSIKAGQLVSIKSADIDNLTLEFEGVDYPQFTTIENTEIKQATDTEVCITDNANKSIKSIVCDSYPKQITVIRDNMATCDDFFRDMSNKQGKLVFTNYLDTQYNQSGVTWVYLDGIKKDTYIMSAVSDEEDKTVSKLVRTSAGTVIAPNSLLNEYEFDIKTDRTEQIQVRFTPSSVPMTASKVYMCRKEDKEVITINSADDTFENILGDKNTYLFAEDGSEITVVYETEKKDKPLKGKYLSVLGDSISSYVGCNGRTDHCVYPNFDVFKPNRMYWGRFCEITGATPLVIDGVGSSTITNIRDNLDGDETFLGMYHDNRAKALGKDDITPDIIVIEGGSNDMAVNAQLGTYDGNADFPTTANKFREAYAIMLDKVRTEYPKAEFYCCTIMARPNVSDYKIKQYNDVIRGISELMGAKIIDFAKCLNSKNYQQFISSDSIHPEYDGHIRMCDEMIKTIL